MKKVITLSLSLCIIISASKAQVDTALKNYKADPNMLIKKSKHQKTAAWLLLGGGLGLFIAGESIIFQEGFEELGNGLGAAFASAFTLGYVSPTPAPVKHSSIAPVMVYSGIGAMLGSIPLFISGHKNKMQAKLLVKEQTLSLAPAGNNKQLAVGMKINF